MDLDDTGIQMGAETVYGTHEDSKMVMSEKVQALAGRIYEEFEQMIARYDEDVVKTLMPLLVNVLECLDASYQANQEHDVELELLREDNEQLVTQYEREKGARKAAEQKLLEFEDSAEGEKKELTAKHEALESIVRMLELKNKNSVEQAGRLEEREGELKKEYSKLHERYTDLFKTHMDHMERTKLLLSGGQMGSERSDNSRMSSNRLNIGRSSGPVSYGFASLEVAEGVDSEPTSPISSMHSSPSLNSELDNMKQNLQLHSVERALETDLVSLENKSMVTSPVSPVIVTPVTTVTTTTTVTNNNTGRVHTKKEQRTGNNLYQELSFQDADALADMDDGADITGGWVHPGEYASSVNDNFYGMGKEVENLIIENTELLATKNALNVVKNDLIVKVDELTSELEMLREEILSLNLVKTRLGDKVTELEEELKKVKSTVSKQENMEEDEDIPLAQRKKFTRVEMARVLMERNQYKERFMELQEAVRWTDMVRATRVELLDNKKRKSIWTFFNNLFSSEQRASGGGNNNSSGNTVVGSSPHHDSGNTGSGGVMVTGGQAQQRLSAVSGSGGGVGGQPQIRYNAGSNRVRPDGQGGDPNAGETEVGDRMGTINAKRARERRKEQHRQVRAHVSKEDGRFQAYGWCLPVRGDVKVSHSHSGVPVPVPVYCRPLAETSPFVHIWCAAGVNLMGGYTKDGGLMVGGSVFYSDKLSVDPSMENTNEMDGLDKELRLGKEAALLETKLSSLVWICTCTGSNGASIVTVIDANNPAEIINSFGVCPHHMLCIASVPGASPNDYNNDVKTTSEVIADEDTAKEIIIGQVTYTAHNPTIFNKAASTVLHNPGVIPSSNISTSPSTNNLKTATVSNSVISSEVTHNSTADTSCNTTDSEQSLLEAVDNNGKEGECEGGKITTTAADDDDDGNVGIITTIAEGTAMAVDGKMGTTKKSVDEVKTRKLTIDEGADNTTGRSATRTADKAKTAGRTKSLVDKLKRNDDGTKSDGMKTTIAADGMKKTTTDVDDSVEQQEEVVEPMSSVLATMWMGSQSGYIYVHSAVAEWNHCLHRVKMDDAVVSIVHIGGRVVAALANARLAVFSRDGETGRWDLSRYHQICLGSPQHSPRCLTVVGDKVWCGYMNRVHVLEPRSLRLVHEVEAHPRKESEVRQLVWLGEGVWVSIRLDSTLRLYHAHTYQHLQDVDIEPYVSKMLGTGKLGFTFVRISALLVSSNRLWIGTSNGVIISVPLSDGAITSSAASAPAGVLVPRATLPVTTATGGGGGGVRVTSAPPGSYIPYCTMAHAQLSFHGHREAVRFFVAVPGIGGMSAASTPSEAQSATITPLDGVSSVPPPAMLVMSGGEGYIDFRNGDDGMEDSVIVDENNTIETVQVEPKMSFRNHLIVWQVIQS